MEMNTTVEPKAKPRCRGLIGEMSFISRPKSDITVNSVTDSCHTKVHNEEQIKAISKPAKNITEISVFITQFTAITAAIYLVGAAALPIGMVVWAIYRGVWPKKIKVGKPSSRKDKNSPIIDPWSGIKLKLSTPGPTFEYRGLQIPKAPVFEYNGMQIPEYEDIRGTSLWYNYKASLIADRGNKCNQFDSVCPGRDIELHHITAVKNAGSNRPENLELLCTIHHALKHRHRVNIMERELNAWKYRRTLCKH